jgi:hypothetical protein
VSRRARGTWPGGIGAHGRIPPVVGNKGAAGKVAGHGGQSCRHSRGRDARAVACVSSPLLGEFQFAAVVDASHHDAANEARMEFTLAAERNPPRPGPPR